jgi:hypothetical protein
VSPQSKEEIYLELSKSATLRDPSYRLQILFAAGVATLGLALNSPAVIIDAMPISPFMGPILAGGLTFASGDLILGDSETFNSMVLVQIFERRQTEPISISPYATSTASHTCRIMAPGPVISDVSICPFLILFANSIPLNVTSALTNVLNPSIG